LRSDWSGDFHTELFPRHASTSDCPAAALHADDNDHDSTTPTQARLARLKALG
jgi:hypothetical protein